MQGWGKLLQESPGSKTIENHPFTGFPEKPLGSSSVQFWGTTVWKLWTCLPAFVANPANLLCVDFKRRVASESSRHCACQIHARWRKKCKGGRNAKFWEWNDNVQYNTWRGALLNDTRLVKIIRNPAKMLNPLFQHSEWHHSSTALLKSTLRRWNSAHHCCVGVPGYRACHVNLV